MQYLPYSLEVSLIYSAQDLKITKAPISPRIGLVPSANLLQSSADEVSVCYEKRLSNRM